LPPRGIGVQSRIEEQDVLANAPSRAGIGCVLAAVGGWITAKFGKLRRPNYATVKPHLMKQTQIDRDPVDRTPRTVLKDPPGGYGLPIAATYLRHRGRQRQRLVDQVHLPASPGDASSACTSAG
jgi:hypothetical protein